MFSSSCPIRRCRSDASRAICVPDGVRAVCVPDGVRVACVPDGSKATDPPLSVFGKVAQPLLAERFSPIVAAGGQGVRDNPIECNLP